MGIICLLGWISYSCNVMQLFLIAFSTTFMTSTSLPVHNESGVTVFSEKSGYLRESPVHRSKEAAVQSEDALTQALDEFRRLTGIKTGVNLLYVAAQKLHALGVSDSNNRTAVMYKFYEASVETIELPEDDMGSIPDLSGSPEKPVVEVPGWVPETSDVPDMCTDARVDAATRIPNGDTYFFRGDFYWKIPADTNVAGYPRRIADDWKGLEGNLDAAFTWSSGKTFFFKGSKYWRFTNMTRDRGYPKPISVGFPGIPDAPDAAFVWTGDGHTYFFKGNLYWLFDSTKDPPVSDEYPKPIKNWRGLPDNIEAALRWENQRTYFFKGKKFYRFDDEKFKVESNDPPYPRFISTWWFHC